MSLNSTPASERLHIGIYGKRNAGKSSLINALTGQNLAIVSDIKGTTTDPVLKSMELLPLGPVVIIDTPGLDDEGALGKLRIQKAYQMLNKTDIAILVVDASIGITIEDEKILNRIKEKEIPYVIVMNKADLLTLNLSNTQSSLPESYNTDCLAQTMHTLFASAAKHEGIHELKQKLASLIPQPDNDKKLVGDLINPMDFVILVVPIDKASPKGRLILPQQQTIRDIIDHGAISVVVKDCDLKETLDKLEQKPSLVITDSQVFRKISQIVPEDVPLTSFSILFARYKGNLKTVVHGARALDMLEDDDTILISEGCTHHRQCGDIGTEKLPKMILEHSGKKLNFEFTSGTEFPHNVDKYKIVIHCGGCMLNEREMKYRLKCAEDAGIPITNYGTAIAHINGILGKCVKLFKL